jgi:hypothetical protein
MIRRAAKTAFGNLCPMPRKRHSQLTAGELGANMIEMPDPAPTRRRFQFRLRTLLLFILFVAVLCSIGVSTNWFMSLAVLIGLPAGLFVARAKEGVLACGFQFFLIAASGCELIFVATLEAWQPVWWSTMGWWLTIVIAVVMGAVYGRLVPGATETRRRRLQIIPLALLSLLLMEGISVKWHATRQREAIVAIRRLGGWWIDEQCFFGMDDPRNGIWETCVYLESSRVTDADLEKLQTLPRLGELFLRDTQVSDAGLESLKGLTQLQLLDLRNTHVTDEGVAKLQKTLPNCKIIR